MIKTNQEISTTGDDIFANDLLDRKDAIIDLSKLIKHQKEPLVLGINADWGAGKTTFVKLWQAYLQEQEVQSIYFSAWENDFSDEPLVAILGELNIYIESLGNNKKSVKTKKFASEVIKEFLPIIAKGIASKFIGNDAVAEISEELAEKMIDGYKTNKNDLANLKKSISKLLDSIDKNQPFVIFIDELDRCKPLYAIELLERIKHIFDIERLIFVLSVDKNNLAKSIQSQYGNIDTDNYLRRFIHLEYPLKNPNVDDFCAVLFKRFKLDSALNLKGVTNNDYDLKIIQKLSSDFDFSLRQIEQIFTKLHIFYTTIEPGFYYTHLTIFILFECLKTYNSQRYDDFLAGDIEVEEIESDLSGIFSDNFIRVNFIRAIIVTTKLRNKPEELKDFINEQKQRGNDDFHQSLNYRENYGSYSLIGFINTTIKHIDFTARFNFETNKQN